MRIWFRNGKSTMMLWNDGGKDKSMSLGDCSDLQRHQAKACLSMLLESDTITDAIRAELERLTPDLKKRFATKGLIPQELNPDVATFFLEFYNRWSVEKRPNTLKNMRNVGNKLAKYFQAKPMRSISVSDAWDFNAWMAEEVAPATRARDIKSCRTIWKHAVSVGLVSRNIFSEIPAGQSVNRDRFTFVGRDVYEACLKECHNQNWRTIIALARIAGMRVHSELCNAQWKHVDFSSNMLLIPRIKTKTRKVPLFPTLRKELAKEPDKTGHIVTVCRNKGSLDREFRKIIGKAGVEPWQQLWHGLRKSRQSELMSQGISGAAVRSWLGNSESVAEAHYEFEVPEDIKKAMEE